MPDSPLNSISLCVISGAPGSGKTTLLTATEKAERRLGRRPVVIVGTFGEAATDAHWLRANGATVIEIAAETGCPSPSAWCEAFVGALRHEPDAIFLETVAPPDAALASAAAEAGLAARFVTVLDAQTDPAPVRNGLNTVVLAKADRLAPEALAALQARWTELAPETVLFVGRNGRITAGDWWRSDDDAEIGSVASEAAAPALTGFTLPASRSLMREPFEKFLAGLPDGVVTLKGFVDFVDEGGTWGVRRENGATVIRPVDTKFPVVKHLGLVVRTDAALDRAALASALTACEAGRRRLVVL
jgi:G3E family GTPase